MADFAAKYPAVEVELLLLDRVVDLVEEGINAAVRIGHLPGSTLITLPLGETRRVVCAAPAYVRQAGAPQSPDELPSHRCILFAGLAPNGEWSFGGKPPRSVQIRPVLRTNQFDVAIDACLRGLGCGQFLCYQVEHLVAVGKLRRVMADFEPAAAPIQIVYPHARLLSSNVRAFVDLAVANLRGVGPSVATPIGARLMRRISTVPAASTPPSRMAAVPSDVAIRGALHFDHRIVKRQGSWQPFSTVRD